MSRAELRRVRDSASWLDTGWRGEALTYLTSAVLTALATVFALKLWRADFRVPFVYWGDAVAVAAHFKTVLETGWYESQPLLGAPVGQAYHDFPTADNLNFVAAHVLGWFTSDFAVAMNTYYVGGFVLAALALVWFLRECGVSRSMSAVMSVLFAIAPYHFLRSEGHLWLASYFTIPLALVVVLRAVRGDALWGVRRSRFPVLGWLTGRGASTVVMVALVATASSYYAVFVVMLLAAAGLIAWWRDRDWRRFLGAAAAGVILVVVVLLNMAPDILYSYRHGTSADGLVRSRAETEIYAFKLAQLILPTPGHRVGFLAEIRSKYDSVYPLVSESPSLGSVAAFGLVCALVVAVLALGGRRAAGLRALTAEQERRTRTILLLSGLVMVAFLCATVGGVSTFISFLTDSLRGWNRMSIVMAALCLAIAGLVLDAWVARAARWRGWGVLSHRVVAAAVAVLVVCVGYLDQVTAGVVPDYEGSAAAFAADAAWTARIEEAMPAAAMVFQLPYIGFPETGPVNGVRDTDQLKPYLHSDTLRWSGAAIKGRSTTDWPGVTGQKPATALVADLAAAGFAGIVIDRQAYGPEVDTLEAALVPLVGEPVAVSDDGRFSLYSLVAIAAEIDRLNDPTSIAAVAAAAIAPVILYAGTADELDADRSESGSREWVFDTGDGQLLVDNGRDQTVSVRVIMPVVAPAGTPSVRLSIAGQIFDVPLEQGVGTLNAIVEVPTGRSAMTLVSGVRAKVTLIAPTVSELDVPQLVLP